jgi:D-glycero-D-manno-heptose 1,7-bisphosphate phosphatase
VKGAAYRPAVFLDRDGVLNEVVRRDGAAASPRRAAEFRITEGAAEAVDGLRQAGFLVFVVTNQPDLARGSLEPAEHDWIMAALRAAVTIDDIAICPHDDADGCGCRKPEPGLLLMLAERHGVDLARSVLVGDGWRDIEAGRRAGCRTVLLQRDYNAGTKADVVVTTLAEAVAMIPRITNCNPLT